MPLKPGAEIDALLAELSGGSVLGELALLALCLGAAAVTVRLLRGAEPRPGSVWFGERIVDGVLFPVLALGAALLVRWLVRDTLPVAVLRLAVPVLGSLAIIRVGVRVLRAAFPASTLVRALERTLSWLVWIGLVLWLTGALPLLRDELEAMRWRLGGSEVTVLVTPEEAHLD